MITDGRWIEVDGKSHGQSKEKEVDRDAEADVKPIILCERCWKNMYLPKVCDEMHYSF